MSLDKHLIPERTCSECSVCCISLRIEEPELTKKADVPCPHLSSVKGCAIYNSRPGVCRNWYCGWRIMPFVNEEMRHDKSKVLIKTDGHNFIFQPLTAQDVSSLLNINVMEAMATLVLNDVSVQTSIPTRSGFTNALSEVNDLLKPSLKTMNLREGRQAMKTLIFHARHAQTLPEKD